jgi:uncharacterized membrane protein YccC
MKQRHAPAIIDELWTQNKDTHKDDSAKKRNRCHAMIRHQNTDAMALASALMSSPPGRPPFSILSEGECLSYRQHFNDELRLRQNHRKNQEVDLLFVSILCFRLR